MKFKSTVLVLLLVVSQLIGITQNLTITDLKNFYKNQEQDKPLKICNDSSAGIFQVVLIRHGEPNLNKKGWRNRDEAVQFFLDYDSSIVIPFDHGPLDLISINLDTIFHSSIPRAHHTAQLSFGDSFNLSGSYNFREFERKPLKWFNVKMPTKFWTTFSRLSWMMGCNDKNIETFKEAKDRAKSNAGSLSLQAEDKNVVILVAHGLHNNYVKKYLRKSGWKKVHNSGNDYLSVKILARELQPVKKRYVRRNYAKCPCS